MASKFILLECNRLRANLNYKNIDEAQDIYKNSWVNNVNSYGIVCNPGDVITCESSAINTIGASSDTLEFLAQPNPNGYIDNQVKINFDYYLNDSGTYGIKLPLLRTQNAFRYDNEINLFYPYDTSIGAVATDILSVRNRFIGDVHLNLGAANEPPSTAPINLEFVLPQTNLVYQIELDKANVGSGYRIFGKYSVVNPATDPTGNSMIIKVLEVIAEGATSGIPTKIEINQAGFSYAGGQGYIISNAVDGLSNPTTTQQFSINAYSNNFFVSRNGFGPDGARYYFAEPSYTGVGLVPYAGMPLNVGFTNNDQADPNWKTRTTQVKLEVPEGLNTPDNIGTILTQQLHRPTIYDNTTADKYINYEFFKMFSLVNDESVIVQPSLLKTPTYQPVPTNGHQTGIMKQAEGKPTLYPNTPAGARAIYYNKICYRFPKKVESLSVFNTWYYGLNNDDANNEINSGDQQVLNIGDFGNQEIGNLGLATTLMVEPTSVAENGLVQYPKYGLIGTNLYFMESVLEKLAIAFRTGEEVFTDLTQPYNDAVFNDPTNYAMNLDVGRYIDSHSTAYPLYENGGDIPQYQRNCFKTGIRRAAEDPTTEHDSIRAVDEGAPYTPCLGNIPMRNNIYYNSGADNDGQQLPQLIIQSRYSDEYQFIGENTDPTNPNFARFQEFHNLCIAQAADPNKFSTTNPNIEPTFIGSYSDDLDLDKILNQGSLLAMAKKYDLAVVPYWPPIFSKPNFVKHGVGEGRPFIAFVSRYELSGTPNFNNTTLAGETYGIDSRNFKYGERLGFDPSTIRQPAMLFYNTSYADPAQIATQSEAYPPVAFLGAVNPNIAFDPSLSRFTISGLNTPMTIGNGLPTDDQFNLDPTGNPEQQCYNLNAIGQIGNYINNFTSGQPPIFINSINMRQNESSIIDSYSGLSISSIILTREDGIEITLLSNGKFSQNYAAIIGADPDNFDYDYPADILNNTLLGKMGFEIQQLLPTFGSTFAKFENPLAFEATPGTFLDKLQRVCKPMTTGADINSAEYQPASTNSLDMPLYDIGTNIGLASRPAVEQGTITAQNLPTKLDYPYLLIYSSIIQGGTNTEYFGGVDGKSKIPVIGYITRNYNQGDFFYSLEQSFNYTCTKSFTLTEIKTEIRLPDGSRPRLQPHNSVIYKITKPMEIPEPFAIPAIKSPSRRKKETIEDDK